MSGERSDAWESRACAREGREHSRRPWPLSSHGSCLRSHPSSVVRESIAVHRSVQPSQPSRSWWVLAMMYSIHCLLHGEPASCSRELLAYGVGENVPNPRAVLRGEVVRAIRFECNSFAMVAAVDFAVRQQPVVRRKSQGYALRDRKWTLERWTNPKRSRRTCNPRYGLHSWRGKSVGVAKRPRERPPTRNPYQSVASQSTHQPGTAVSPVSPVKLGRQ
jgi:hypothetical protein